MEREERGKEEEEKGGRGSEGIVGNTMAEPLYLIDILRDKYGQSLLEK